jgi:hypothetical protein
MARIYAAHYSGGVAWQKCRKGGKGGRHKAAMRSDEREMMVLRKPMETNKYKIMAVDDGAMIKTYYVTADATGNG